MLVGEGCIKDELKQHICTLCQETGPFSGYLAEGKHLLMIRLCGNAGGLPQLGAHVLSTTTAPVCLSKVQVGT